MYRSFGAIALLTLAVAMPVQDAAAQDPLGGALLGGAAGAIIGGVAGGGRGAAAGAIIGGAAGAIIGSQGQARAGGYYWYQGGCYLQRGDGYWTQVSPAYCGGPAYVPPPPPPAPVYAPAPPPGDDAVAWCMQRYRSYDPRSGTFVGYDGIRRPCP
jgi:hypothetical protein